MPRTSALARSSHCGSSTTSSNGRSAAARRSSSSTALAASRRAGAQAQRHLQCPGQLRLHRVQLIQFGQTGLEQLVQGGVRDVHLELRAGRPQHPGPGVGGEGGGMIEQSGLADPPDHR
ncbi:hypothetical protein [Streptomyces prunicolor]|uniref:hypothetical protein n=1 Tax=Streptomyces prunicolor TaxID=67348 RepID=UPI00341AE0EE